MGAWAQDLLEELSARQRAVVKLRWGWGLSRREIARVLGISEKAVKRDLERSGHRLAELVEELRAGQWCERRRSVVTAYAFDLLSPARATRAEAHLRACPGCRGLVHELRRHGEGLAAVAPAPLLAEGSSQGSLHSVVEALEGVRTQLSDLASSAKHHAISLSLRTSDPTPLSGARPGAVAAAVAGCLAVSTGAYCAIEGTVPEAFRFGPLVQERARAHTADSTQSERVVTPPEPAPPVVAPPQAEAQAPVVEPTPAPSAAPPEPAAEPSQDFFGSEPSTPPVASAAAVDPPPSEAAPARAAARGEFGGP